MKKTNTMNDHSELQKHIPNLQEAIHQSLAQAGMGHLRVHSIRFSTEDAAGCPGGVSPKLVCHKTPGGTLVCENVCP